MGIVGLISITLIFLLSCSTAQFVKNRNYVPPTLTASATVEALLAILEVENNPDSRQEFYVKIENVFEGKP